MKKGIIGLLSLGLVFGIGTSVMANTDSEFPNFKEMLPFMQEMHSDLSDEQLEDMYNSCHGEDGRRGPGAGMRNGSGMRAGFGPEKGADFEPGTGFGPGTGNRP